ncbi:MAG: hypothetical protein ABSF53_17880 [Terracidiphilus sp.]|jgi:hypothetical protein
MFDIVQAIWDLFMVRDAIRKRQLTWRKGLLSAGLVLLGYLILVPAAMAYERHPEVKPLFMAAVVLAAIDFVFLVGLALYWWKRSITQRS